MGGNRQFSELLAEKKVKDGKKSEKRVEHKSQKIYEMKRKLG